MPRGKAPAKKKVPAKRSAPSRVARAPRRDAPPAPAPSKPLEVAAVPVAEDRRPLGSVDIDSLSGDALRSYARRAGVLPRDVAGLTEDRLRQNTKLVIQNYFAALSE